MIISFISQDDAVGRSTLARATAVGSARAGTAFRLMRGVQSQGRPGRRSVVAPETLSTKYAPDPAEPEPEIMKAGSADIVISATQYRKPADGNKIYS